MCSPLVSIVIPTFNSERTLRRAIDSVVGQNCQNWEVWVVDGCSTDRTVDTIRDYALADRRIQYVSESDDGIYDAINKGIQLARWKWLYFMGCDDELYDDQTLNEVFSGDSTEDYDILYGNVFSNKEIIHGKFSPEKLVKTPIPHQAMFYRRTIFQRYGGYDISCRCRADYLKTVELFFEEGIRWKYIKHTIAHYARGGYSDSVYDIEFDNMLEKTFLRCFGRSLERKKIYEGMLWTVPYNLEQGSLIKAIRFIWNSRKIVEYLPHIAYGLKQRALRG